MAEVSENAAGQANASAPLIAEDTDDIVEGALNKHILSTDSAWHSIMAPLKQGHHKAIVAVLQHGESFFTASEDHMVVQWLLNGECLCIFQGHTEPVTELAMLTEDPNSPLLSSSLDTTINVWDVPSLHGHQGANGIPEVVTLEPQRTLMVGTPVLGLAVTKGGQLLCTSGPGGATIWKYPDFVAQRRLKWEGPPVRGPLHVDQNGVLWAFSGPQALGWFVTRGMVGLMEDAVSGAVGGARRRLSNDMGPFADFLSCCSNERPVELSSPAETPRNTETIVGSTTGVPVYDWPDFEVVHENLLSAVFPGGWPVKHQLLTATEDGHVYVWQPDEENPDWNKAENRVASLKGHEVSVKAMAVVAAEGTESNSPVKKKPQWLLGLPKLDRSGRQSRRPQMTLALTFGDCPRLFTASLDCTVVIWDCKQWEKLGSIFTQHPCLAMTLDIAHEIYYAEQNLLVNCALQSTIPTVRAYDASTGELVRDIRRCRIREVALPQVFLLVGLAQVSLFALRLLAPWNTIVEAPLYPTYFLVGTAFDPVLSFVFPSISLFNLGLAVAMAIITIVVAFGDIHEVLKDRLEITQRQVHQERMDAPQDLFAVNRANAPMKPGSGESAHLYYCGRQMAAGVMPDGSDGMCGPNNGPQCPDCKGLCREPSQELKSKMKIIKLCLKAVHFGMPVLTVILTVPLVKIFAYYLACSLNEVRGSFHLGFSETGGCFAEFRIVAVMGLFPILCVYLWVVIPFSVVDGDVRYVQKEELWIPASWRANCGRKAGALYLGLFHRSKKHAFSQVCPLLMMKVGLPFFEICFKQSRLVCAISYTVLVLSCSSFMIYFDTYTSMAANICLNGLVLCVDWIFLCGLACAMLDAVGDIRLIAGLIVGLLVIGFLTFQFALKASQEVPDSKASSNNAMGYEKV